MSIRANSLNPGLRFLVLFVVALQGCTTRQPVLPPDFDPAAMPGHGIVVGSVTSVPDTRWSPAFFEASAYFYRGIDAPGISGVLRSGRGSALAALDGERCERGIPDANGGIADDRSIPDRDCGRLFAVPLPAGRYRIHAVQVREPNATSIESAPHFSQPLETFEWTVVAGQIAYLGEFRSRICMGSTGRGLGVAAVAGEVRDAFDRDQRLLALRFPGLQGRSIVQGVLRTEPWLWHAPAPLADTGPEVCEQYLRADTAR